MVCSSPVLSRKKDTFLLGFVFISVLAHEQAIIKGVSYSCVRSIYFDKWSVHCTEDCIFIFYASLFKSVVSIILLLVVPCKQISSHYIGTQRAIPGKGITEVLASLIRSSFCVRIVPLKPMTSTLRNGASTSNPILVHQPTLQYTRPSLTRTTGVVTIIYFCLLLHLLLLSRHRPGLTNIIYLSEGEDIWLHGYGRFHEWGGCSSRGGHGWYNSKCIPS